MMFSGSRRRMFRNETPATKKPSLTRQAIGILASSRELMDEVQPVRMANGGNVNVIETYLDQARRMATAQGLTPGSMPYNQVVGILYNKLSSTDPSVDQLFPPRISQVVPVVPSLSDEERYGSQPVSLNPLSGLSAGITSVLDATGRSLIGQPVRMGEGNQTAVEVPRPRRIKPQGTPIDIGAGITSAVDAAGRSLIGQPIRMGEGNQTAAEVPQAAVSQAGIPSLAERIIGQPVRMGEGNPVPQAASPSLAERLISQPIRMGEGNQKVDSPSTAAEVPQAASPSLGERLISQPIRMGEGNQEEADLGKLAANYSMTQPVLKELVGQRTTQRRSLKQAQNQVGQAQRAYDKALEKNDQTAMGVALSKLEAAKQKVARETLDLSEVEKLIGEEKMSKFFGKIENINRQLEDENISESRRQTLLEERDKVQAQMEEAGLRKFEGDDTDRSDRPQKPVPQAEGEGESVEEAAAAQADAARADAARAENNAALEDIAGGDSDTLAKLQEERDKINSELEAVEANIAKKPSPGETEIVKQAMEMADYDEQEVRDNLKKDSFWNALMVFGLQMAAGASEGGDRFSNMARAAVLGLNEFNKDMKEKEKSAYARYRDKKADAINERKLRLAEQTSEIQAEQAVLSTLTLKNSLNKTAIDQLFQQRRFDLSEKAERRQQSSADLALNAAIAKEVRETMTDQVALKTEEKMIMQETGLPKDKVTYQMIEDRVRNKARANLTPGFRKQLEEEAKKRGIIK